MKSIIPVAVAAICIMPLAARSQRVRTTDVPQEVRAALQKKYPSATSVSWEREKGNYEANWGGASREDNSVLFTPQGSFVEIVVAIPVSKLPAALAGYVRTHYGSAKIGEAGKVTTAAGDTRYEVEVRGRDLLFDEKGNFIRKD
ncbi:MAG TPA: PepSY-like domain-containing protein [Puia sp.]|nr:PepSY-like domain-containing protein [Puia sp.]